MERVRRVPLTDILSSEGVEFRRIGREVVTLCPWHQDTHPSLTVNDDKNLCFCFACGGGSDGIAYIRQKFALSFSDAVERIAVKNAIAIEYDNLDPEEALRIAAQRRKALDDLARQQDMFKAKIRSDVALNARQWLLDRGITPEASRYFGVGYAEAGYFGGRITIPIHDHRGSLVGFTGRRIDGGTAQKYKNSANSELFDKGLLLYNEHRALPLSRTVGHLVFVEGHLDVVAMWQQGIGNVVAIQGNAGLSSHVLNRVLRHCKRFVLCFDGDSGGQTAIENFIKVAGPLACSGQVNITVAQLPEGKDPDDCIRSGIDMHSIIENAPQWLDWQLDYWLASIDRSDTHRFSLIETAVRNLVESIKSPALRQYYVDRASKVLAMDAKTASKLAQNWSKSLPKLSHSAEWARPAPSWLRASVERRALRSYIHFPESREKIRHLMSGLVMPSHIWLWNRICELERHGREVDKGMVMAVLAVCEPSYTRSLRSIVVPTIKLSINDGIISHTRHVLSSSIETSEQ